MPVFEVVLIAPNGNRRSRTVAAHTVDDALEAWRAEIELEVPRASDRRGFVYEIRLVPDPDGSYEKELVEAEQRRMDAEYYRRK